MMRPPHVIRNIKLEQAVSRGELGYHADPVRAMAPRAR